MKGKESCALLLTAIMVFFLVVVPVSAQITELWNRTYDGGYDDWCYDVATDTTGNVIVTGASWKGGTSWSEGSDEDYYTIKYDSAGTDLWSRTYDGGGNDGAHSVATDTAGNVIVTGGSWDGSTWNYYTIKYDSAGTELWNRTYDGGYDDMSHGVATDATGNVIVTGWSEDGSTTNYYTIKYDSDGTELWNRTYDGGVGGYGAHSVATDTAGNVIVTGGSFDGSDQNCITIKYDSDGTELWNRTYDGGYDDMSHGVATDTAGNVIVTGQSFDGSTWNYYTIKYDSAGTELWNITYDGGDYDEAQGVATDAIGDVIVTGNSRDNYYTIKYREVVPDTTPPASITYLGNATGETWINWTWTNPLDADFNHTMVYLDGVWQTNTSDPFYNATGLTSETSYEIGTQTVDMVGNINTTWINQTTKTLPDTIPPVSITNLQNATGETWINWTWTNPPDADFNHTMVYLDGVWQTNTSDPFYNATGLTSETSYEIGTQTVDMVGNINTTWINQTARTKTTQPAPTPTPAPRGGGGGGGGGGGPADTDGDGIWDIIERQNGTDPNDPCDPNPDSAACLAKKPPTPTPAPTIVSTPIVTPTPTATPSVITLTPTPLYPRLRLPLNVVVILIGIAVAVALIIGGVAYMVLRRR